MRLQSYPQPEPAASKQTNGGNTSCEHDWLKSLQYQPPKMVGSRVMSRSACWFKWKTTDSSISNVYTCCALILKVRQDVWCWWLICWGSMEKERSGFIGHKQTQKWWTCLTFCLFLFCSLVVCFCVFVFFSRLTFCLSFFVYRCVCLCLVFVWSDAFCLLVCHTFFLFSGFCLSSCFWHHV